MSQWTHCTATFRIDAFEHDLTPEKIEEIIGEPRGHDRPWADYVDSVKLLPYGSEGSLEYTIYESPDESLMAAYVITVFGDLRDYDDDKALVAWFEDVCSHFVIRQAMITIDVEYQKTVFGSLVNEIGDEPNEYKFKYVEIREE